MYILLNTVPYIALYIVLYSVIFLCTVEGAGRVVFRIESTNRLYVFVHYDIHFIIHYSIQYIVK